MLWGARLGIRSCQSLVEIDAPSWGTYLRTQQMKGKRISSKITAGIKPLTSRLAIKGTVLWCSHWAFAFTGKSAFCVEKHLGFQFTLICQTWHQLWARYFEGDKNPTKTGRVGSGRGSGSGWPSRPDLTFKKIRDGPPWLISPIDVWQKFT